MPQISVIVPVYKVEPYLHKCVDSILAQSFADFELILVDDGSPDNCGKICDEYAERDCRIKVLHKKNGGVSSARNAGIAVASGKYLVFCDSDDYYLNALEDFFSVAECNIADCVVASFIKQSAINGKENNVGENENIVTNIKLENRFRFIIDKLNGEHGQWAVWGTLYRKEIIEKHNIRFCETCGDYAEDLAFNISYLLFCDKIVEMKKQLYCYNDLRIESMMAQSSNCYKLNEANEAVFSVETNFISVFKGSDFEHLFYLIHYQFLEEEYIKVFKKGEIKKLPSTSKKIYRYQWYANNTKQFLKNKKIVFDYYSFDSAVRALTLSKYIVDGNYINYRINLYLMVHFLNDKDVYANNISNSTRI